MQLNRVLHVLTGKQSILIVLATLILLDLLMVAAIIFPSINGILSKNNTFQIVVITCLLQVVLLLASRAVMEMPVVIVSDALVQRKIIELIEEDEDISSVKVLSAGLSSRAPFLRSLIEHSRNMKVSIAACYSEANPDELDRKQYGPSNHRILTNQLEPEEASRLKIYQSFNTPSVRCIILASTAGPRYAFLGWYTYYGKNKHIQGRKNIQFQVDSTTAFGNGMLHFVNTFFEKHTGGNEAELIWPEGRR